ncbi:hypothetical protein F5J12DRAFT_784536 [Pisolithus orientalis]|uniref:uncharacterized protein n=1 Tax=Pisolithus orientalis TaxID=936130 RepID=UPI0022252DCE|nr:uncharacterized protein F5J12DRAFT_784536 [Pisolithus orientalis]KAI5999758.1 hypothetical protein F5J12DRAFT_784536 [Pisolithus orientalis]
MYVQDNCRTGGFVCPFAVAKYCCDGEVRTFPSVKYSFLRFNELQELYEQTKKDFGEQSQRVIGHVVWSPAITVGTTPHGFAKDVRVVELEKAIFCLTFKENVIDLVQFGFKHPAERLLVLRDSLVEDCMRHPKTKDHDGENSLYVPKRSLTPLTTIGRATGCFSYRLRRVFQGRRLRGDDRLRHGEFGGLLTGGSGRTDSSDITYATPMFWLWLIIKAEFSNANLYPVFT